MGHPLCSVPALEFFGIVVRVSGMHASEGRTSLSFQLPAVEKPQTFEAIQDFLLLGIRENGKSVIKVIDTITFETLAKFESPGKCHSK